MASIRSSRGTAIMLAAMVCALTAIPPVAAAGANGGVGLSITVNLPSSVRLKAVGSGETPQAAARVAARLDRVIAARRRGPADGVAARRAQALRTNSAVLVSGHALTTVASPGFAVAPERGRPEAACLL